MNDSQALVEVKSGMPAILEMAKDPGMDVAKLQALVSMQEGLLDRQAKQEFAVDFVRMKPHLKRIENKHLNSQTKSKYAKLEDLNKEIDPVLEQFGFSSMTPVRRQDENSVTVAAILLHKNGHQEETELTLPLDKAGIQGTVNKTGPHAIASSIKYCRRIALCAILNLSTGDGDDRDGNQDSEQITVEQAAALDMRLRAISDKALPNFLKWAKVESMIDIPAKFYPAAVKAVANMEQEAKKQVKP
jgi:ERF superfamily protein